MIKGTWLLLDDGTRIGAVHVGGGKLKGCAYSIPAPTKENPFARLEVTDKMAHKAIKAAAERIGKTLTREKDDTALAAVGDEVIPDILVPVEEVPAEDDEGNIIDPVIDEIIPDAKGKIKEKK